MSKATTAQPTSRRDQDDASHSGDVDAGKANTPQDDTAAALVDLQHALLNSNEFLLRH